MYRQDQYRELRAINFIKYKWCSEIKGRTRADGIPQRKYIPCEEATSLTIELESLLASLIIYTHEGISVQNFDVPGAYIHTSLSDDMIVHMKFKGEFVDIMCEVKPEYKKS